MHRLVPAVTVIAVLTTRPVRGAEVEEVPATPLRQSLGPHLYIPRDGVPDPFTASFIASSSGFATGSAKGPTFDLQGKPVNLENYKILAYSQVFAGQWGIADFWALRLRLLGSIYSGTNTPGLVGVGVNGLVRGSFGTTFGFNLADRLRLGLVVDVVWGPSVAISILDTIRQSVSSGRVDTLVEMALFQAAVELDLRELGSIPLGIGAEYSAGYSLGRARFRRYVAGLGFFYTGRRGLTLGLDLAYRRAPLGTQEVFVSSFSGVFSLRYTFD